MQNIEKNIHISTKKEEEIEPVMKVDEKKPNQAHHVEKKRIKKTRKPKYPKNM